MLSTCSISPDQNQVHESAVTQQSDRRLGYLLALSVALLIFQLSWPPLAMWRQMPSPGRQGLIQLTANGLSSQCLVSLPEDFRAVDQAWPLVIFLHGSGSRGDAPSLVRRGGLPLLIDQGLRWPAIIASPQCLTNRGWEIEAVAELITDLKHRYRINSNRVYLCGFSMGAEGVWRIAAARPEQFAAVAPIACGTNDLQGMTALVKMPVWAFHGDRDVVVPIASTRRTVEAIRQAGGAPRFTAFKNHGHSICEAVLSKPKLKEWLFNQDASASASSDIIAAMCEVPQNPMKPLAQRKSQHLP